MKTMLFQMGVLLREWGTRALGLSGGEAAMKGNERLLQKKTAPRRCLETQHCFGEIKSSGLDAYR
jgi:hypothetical protein